MMDQILNSRELWNSDEIMTINANAGLPFDILAKLTRAIEQAVMQKLREQKPVAVVIRCTTYHDDETTTATDSIIATGDLPVPGTELFTNPVPSAPGMVLVPIEPTEAMLCSGGDYFDGDCFFYAKKVWTGMMGAARSGE